jgi:hypothetical protein
MPWYYATKVEAVYTSKLINDSSVYLNRHPAEGFIAGWRQLSAFPGSPFPGPVPKRDAVITMVTMLTHAKESDRYVDVLVNPPLNPNGNEVILMIYVW